jgi:hypothetical protein
MASTWVTVIHQKPSTAPGDSHHCASAVACLSWRVPRAALFILRWAEPMNEREVVGGGLIVAAALVVISVSLINKFAGGD